MAISIATRRMKAKTPMTTPTMMAVLSEPESLCSVMDAEVDSAVVVVEAERDKKWYEDFLREGNYII